MRSAFKRPLAWGLIVIALVLVVVVRRWVHHAQLELVPVIVPPEVSAADVVHPPPAAIVRRMALDVRDALAPPARLRLAVLTFDDGPFPVTTPVLLAQLQALRVPAAFFLIGNDTREQPALAQRIAVSGMEVGDHTLTHPQLIGMSADLQRAEISAGAAQIRSVTGIVTRYFRPPHGNYDSGTIDAARAESLTVVLWDVDPGDWRDVSVDTIVANVTRQARAPAVILLHNGRFSTVEALPKIVAAYRAAGFTFVSLSELQARVPLSAINDPVKTSVRI